jgi:hypothetical protein
MNKTNLAYLAFTGVTGVIIGSVLKSKLNSVDDQTFDDDSGDRAFNEMELDRIVEEIEHNLYMYVAILNEERINPDIFLCIHTEQRYNPELLKVQHHIAKLIKYNLTIQGGQKIILNRKRTPSELKIMEIRQLMLAVFDDQADYFLRTTTDDTVNMDCPKLFGVSEELSRITHDLNLFINESYVSSRIFELEIVGNQRCSSEEIDDDNEEDEEDNE